MDHTEYATGQTWHSNRGNWQRTWTIVEIDHRMSVTLLRVDPHPILGNAKWIGSELFSDEMEKRGAKRVS